MRLPCRPGPGGGRAVPPHWALRSLGPSQESKGSVGLAVRHVASLICDTFSWHRFTECSSCSIYLYNLSFYTWACATWRDPRDFVNRLLIPTSSIRHYKTFWQFYIHTFYYVSRHNISRCITKVMNLKKLKYLIIWNGVPFIVYSVSLFVTSSILK